MAEEAKALDAVMQDLQDLTAMIGASEDLRHMIRNPIYSRADKSAAVEALAKKAKFQDLTARFLGTLVQNNRLYCVESVIAAAATLVRKRKNMLEAQVESAAVLSKADQNSLKASLKKMTGADIILDVKVNEDLLGGVTVTVGSHRYDASVRSKLDRLQAAMSRQDDQTNDSTPKEVA